jgi:FMNH2-dependent dimethyl sulfone monooxygenase
VGWWSARSNSAHWGIDYNRKLAQLAEEAGFEYALTQIRFTAGYGAEYQHESVAFSHALLAATRLKVIAAILPGPWQPALAAKQLATIDQLTNGRVAINVVSGWFKGEFQAIGEHWLEHDERYRRSEEFIRSLKGIWTQDNFTFRGDFYRFDNYSLKPKPLGRPEIFQGGSSVPRGTWPRGCRTGISPTATPRKASRLRSMTFAPRLRRTIIQSRSG